MVRKVLGVIAGSLFNGFFTILSLWAVYGIFGSEFAFRESGYEASTLWSTVALVVGFFAAMISALICKVISRSKGAVRFFAIFYLLFGLSFAIYLLTVERAEKDVRPVGISFTQAGEKGYSPDWYNFAIPFVGTIGVLLVSESRQRPTNGE